MTYAPYVRIFLRYVVGAILTVEVGDMLASDPDVVDALSVTAATAVGIATEWWYRRAKKAGGAV